MDSSSSASLPDVIRTDAGVWEPRIRPVAYVVVQFLFLGLAIATALSRTALRVKKFRRVTLDDCALILALLLLCASVALTYRGSAEAYLSTASNLGLVGPQNDPSFGEMIREFEILDDAANIVSWGSIFIVKLSFILFLKQLVSRVARLRIWWWVVFAITAASTPVCMFMGFYICTDFSENLIKTCGPDIIYKQQIFLIVNCALDILTDTLILTIPIFLLWKVQISLKRKVALGTVLCLSVFMIIIAILRVALDQTTASTGISAPDTAWLYFWTNVEGAVAIIMVSLTAFRSMLGQASTSDASSAPGAYGAASRNGRLGSNTSDRHVLVDRQNAATPEIRKEVSINQHITTRSISKPIPIVEKNFIEGSSGDNSPV